MSISGRGDFFNRAYNVSQPKLNSSDRIANLKAKTKFANAVNLAKNGGVLTKGDGSKYTGTVRTSSTAVISAASYADLLAVTKGKYLLTPPPSSNLIANFFPENGEIFYGNYSSTRYDEANIPVTILGKPGVQYNYDDDLYTYTYPNQLVVANATAVHPYNNISIIVDPEFRLFYGENTCGNRGYFKNVFIDPTVDLRWTKADGNEDYAINIASSRAYNQEQAQRILANQAQSLRGFKYPTPVYLVLDNCDSKPSITPVAPNAPVIQIIKKIPGEATFTNYIVTISWLHLFDGGSPITSEPEPPNIFGYSNPIWGYTIWLQTPDDTEPFLQASIPPRACVNEYTITAGDGSYGYPVGTDIWITASSRVPKSNWTLNIFDPLPDNGLITLTSAQSNHVKITDE